MMLPTRNDRRLRVRRCGAVGVTVAALVSGALGCSRENLTTGYPEVTAGSIPPGTLDGTTTRSTRPGTTSRGASTTRTPGSKTTRPPNPTYADYCAVYIEKFSNAQSIPKDQRVEAQKQILRDLLAIAPAAIKDDLQLYSDYAATVTDDGALSTSKLPPDVKAADSRLNDWHETNCGTD